MARTPHDHTSGQSDSSSLAHQDQSMDALSGDAMTLPGNEFVTDAQMLRDGQDLVLRSPEGEEITIHNYFSADPAPVIQSEGGAALTPDLVESFVQPIDGVQFAQKGSVDDSSPVGVIKEASGEATVTRTDGVVEKAGIGTPIYEGDIVETKGDGAVNITFVDDTTFAVSENARLAIDEYVFDPATQSGESNFSVLRGVFVFTSGLIGREDPDDVAIDTPVGSIGIRGTTILGDINPEGESQITVVEGAIVVTNAEGETTLSQQYETVTIAGFDAPIANQGVLEASEVAESYNVVRTVSAPLFSTFEQGATEDAAEPAVDTAPAETQPEADPVNTAPATDRPADAEPVSTEPVNKTEAAPGEETIVTEAVPTTEERTATDSSFDSGFDASAEVKSDSVFTTTAPTETASRTFTATSQPAPTGTTAPLASTTTTRMASTTDTTGTTTGTLGGTTTTTVLPPLALQFFIGQFSETMLTAGLVIGVVQTTVNYNNVNFGWANLPTDGGGDPLFTLVQIGPNRAEIRLTADAVGFLQDGSVTSFEIFARLPDGRMTREISQLPVNDYPDLNLNDVISGAAGGGFIPNPVIGSGNGHGSNVAALGDVNHDGKADYAFANNTATGGRVFVDDVTGNNFMVNLATFGVTDSTNLSLAGIGDFNRDGIGDIAIGVPHEDAGGVSKGKVFIVDGATGAVRTQIVGFADGEMAGMSVSGAGDYNGDGFSDLIIGAPDVGTQGASYIIFGGAGATVNIGSFTGFTVNGIGDNAFGHDVSGIGDFNRDGYDDLAMTEPGAGTVKVHFGNFGGSAGSGTTITGFGNDLDVFGVGTYNADARSDFAVLDRDSDILHVLMGATLGSNFSIAGFGGDLEIYDSMSNDLIAAGSAGDFNGDSNKDIAVATRTGNMVDIYVVYGKGGLLGGYDLASASDTDVFHMTLNLNSPQFNLADPANDPVEINLSTAGDLDGDGFDDLLIGVPDAFNDDGGLLVIRGRAEGFDFTNGIVTFANTATMANQSLLGGMANDVMTNNGMTNIAFSAGHGDDLININGGSYRELDGGSGMDAVQFLTGSFVNLVNLGDKITGIEKMIMGSANQTLTIGIDQIFDLLQSSKDGILRFDTTQANTTLNIANNDNPGTNLASLGFSYLGNAGGFDEYSFGSNYAVYISDNIATVAVV